MVMVGRKGGGTSPPKTIPGTRDGMLASFDVGSEEAVEGPDFWLKWSRNTPGSGGSRAREKKITNWEKGERWDGRVGSESPADDANCSGTPSGVCVVGRCWEACSSWVPVPLFGLSSWLAG